MKSVAGTCDSRLRQSCITYKSHDCGKRVIRSSKLFARPCIHVEPERVRSKRIICSAAFV